MTTTEAATSVRLARSNRIHAIYCSSKSGIFARAMIPACGVSIGTNARRIATDEPVNCPDCLAHQS